MRWCSRSWPSAGAALVLFNAPPNGDASPRGNLFGLLAMLLWVGYVVSTRHFRRDMDVATFMATVCPIAAVAVLPLALAHGDVFGMSSTGWTYMLILTLPHRGRCPRSAGVRPEDDPDRHDRHRPGGSARPGRRLVVPAAGRDAAPWQVVGVAIVVGGLLAFLVLNQPAHGPAGRGSRRRTGDW